MNRLAWLTADAWLDEDGRHVWLAHDCSKGREETMLPYPTWHAEGGKVQPSVNCGACGMHTFVPLSAKPAVTGPSQPE